MNELEEKAQSVGKFNSRRKEQTPKAQPKENTKKIKGRGIQSPNF
jgi:hypothetical protein